MQKFVVRNKTRWERSLNEEKELPRTQQYHDVMKEHEFRAIIVNSDTVLIWTNGVAEISCHDMEYFMRKFVIVREYSDSTTIKNKYDNTIIPYES